ncbi:MAG: type II toxin-antitoxin system Phd/YefM family antitoxin [Candidatus Limnocylindria bacterium]
MREIAVSKFKAEVLGLLEEIAETGEEIIVTKRGRPLARVRTARQSPSLRNSVKFLVNDEKLIAPIDVRWEGSSDGP